MRDTPLIWHARYAADTVATCTRRVHDTTARNHDSEIRVARVWYIRIGTAASSGMTAMMCKVRRYDLPKVGQGCARAKKMRRVRECGVMRTCSILFVASLRLLVVQMPIEMTPTNKTAAATMGVEILRCFFELLFVGIIWR